MNDMGSGPLIVRQTVSTATANSLRERILRGDFMEGQSLLQDALAAEYGVSRIPLREALRQLESEGLVTSIPHRGYMVVSLSMEEIVERCEIRALMECDVLERAIPYMTSDHFDRAEKVLDKCEHLLAGDTAAYDHGNMNWEFHSILYSASNRQRSIKLISSLHHSPDRLVRMKVASTIGLNRILREHRELLELCRQGKTTEAVECLRAHILEAVELFKNANDKSAEKTSA